MGVSGHPTTKSLTQHPQSLLAPLVPRRQGGVVHDAGDKGVVIAAAYIQSELALHRVGGTVVLFNLAPFGREEEDGGKAERGTESISGQREQYKAKCEKTGKEF